MGVSKPYTWEYERSPTDSDAKAVTFSVGIYQWIPKASGTGCKKSKTIRVKGYVADPKAVYGKAEEICRRLNAEGVRADAPPKWVQTQYAVARPASAKRVTVKDRVTEMARMVWEPRMKGLGFRRTGRKFWRNTAQVCQVVELCMGRWGTSRAGSIEVLMGVFWHEVEEILRNPSRKRMPPPECACTFRMDLGGAMPQGTGVRWNIDLRTNLEKVGQAVLDKFLRYGVSWLAFRSDIKNVRNRTKYLRPEGRNAYSTLEMQAGWSDVVFLVMMGKKEAAKRELLGYLTSWPSDVSVFAVAKQLGIDLGEAKSEWRG